jgi:pimeloyl-ACP methyl ester carboxylesterase
MQKHTFPRVAAVAVVAMSIAVRRSDAIAQRAPNPGRATGAGRYTSVNGLNMYHEVHGTGRPLVLLHGAFSNINTDFGAILPRFARTRRVIAVELQARRHAAGKRMRAAPACSRTDSKTLTARHERSDDGVNWVPSKSVTLRKVD